LIGIQHTVKSKEINEKWSLGPLSSVNVPYLSGRQDGNEILIDQSDLLQYSAFILLIFEFLDSQPEQHVLFAVLKSQVLAKHTPSSYTAPITVTTGHTSSKLKVKSKVVPEGRGSLGRAVLHFSSL